MNFIDINVKRIKIEKNTDKLPNISRDYNANYIEGTVWLFIKEILC